MPATPTVEQHAAAEAGGATGESSPRDTESGIEKTDVDRDLELSCSAIVDFDGDGDLENPLNWSTTRRWFLVILVSFMSTMVTLATVICTPAAPQILEHFHSTNYYDSVILVSVWEIGEVFGPLFFAPMSELYGRLPVWHVSCVLFIIFSVGTALSNSLNMVIAFRFLNGIVSPMVLSTAIASDVLHENERGKGMAVVNFAPLVGPTFGPAIGGAISQSFGWRWVFWFVVIVSAAVEFLIFLTLRETYAPKILQVKACKLRKQSGRQDLKSKYQEDKRPRDVFLQATVRPLKFLFLSPIVLMLSLYLGIIYGYLYLILTTMSEMLENTYHFSAEGAGLSFFGMGLGLTIGTLFCYFLLDRNVQKKADPKPENRLPTLLVGSLVMPIGLFLYGWTAQKAYPWILPIIGTTFIGVGLEVTEIPIRTYLVDAYTLHAASAVAAGLFFQSVTGAVLPLAGPPLYARFGQGWGNSILGFVALVFVPVPVLFYRYGERLRARFPVEL